MAFPEELQKSWYAFDHFYSDSAYPVILPFISEPSPGIMMDIGANAGELSIPGAKYNPDVRRLARLKYLTGYFFQYKINACNLFTSGKEN